MSLCFRDSNVNFRGPTLSLGGRMSAIRAGTINFAQVVGAIFGCFRRRPRAGKRVTIVDDVTNAGKLKTTPTCSTSGQCVGRCLRYLYRLYSVGKLGRVHVRSVHPKFIHAPLLKSNKHCPLRLGTGGMTGRVMHGVRGGGSVVAMS